MSNQLPYRLAYYADDLTGATDVLEVLALAGIDAALFLEPPSSEKLAKFPDLQAFGIAGTSRSMSTQEMSYSLRVIFGCLNEAGPAFVHYKTCSTFDSSASIGNIGYAMELARNEFGNSTIPIVVSAPHLGRYQVFGNLFARASGAEVYRLDRHPTMSRHPITPMDESDLREVLARQTELDVALINVLQVESSAPSCLAKLIDHDQASAVLIDALTMAHLEKVGQALLARDVPGKSQFVVGSSGVEAALTHAWKSVSTQGAATSTIAANRFAPVDQLLVITGSCSPVNKLQVEKAEQEGFQSLAINTAHLVDSATSQREIDRVCDKAVEYLSEGLNLVLHSSLGPEDARISETIKALRSNGLTATEIQLHSGNVIGSKLGIILKQILKQHAVPRVGIAGGDSSGYIVRQLQVDALRAIAPFVTGAPLCEVSAGNEFDKLQLVLKGGQVGTADVWAKLLRGFTK